MVCGSDVSIGMSRSLTERPGNLRTLSLPEELEVQAQVAVTMRTPLTVWIQNISG